MSKAPKVTPKRAGAGAALAAAIALIVGAVVSTEGGYVDHKDDPGGRTNHGITEATARANGFEGDLRILTVDQSVSIYGSQYVLKPKFDLIIQRSVALGEEVVDTGVNLGPYRPSCYVQTALNSLNRQQADYRDVTVDCQIGPATMAAYDALVRKRGQVKACEMVLKLVDAQQAGHYLNLAKDNSKFESFMPGWTDNRLGNVPIVRCAEGGVSG